jgi:hypothetical protein
LGEKRIIIKNEKSLFIERTVIKNKIKNGEKKNLFPPTNYKGWLSSRL